LILFATYKF
jgi:hypothetical protein